MTRAIDEDFDIKSEKRLEQSPWLARIGEHNFLRRRIRLGYGKDLFASAGLDNGTERLLRLLAKPGSPLLDETGGKLRLLDLGCGVGALGISIARALGKERVHVVMSDRDRLAIEFARENSKLCRVHSGKEGRDGDTEVLDAGLAYEPATNSGQSPFDMIVSNVPASAGDDGLFDLVYGAGPLLKKGGFVAIVYVIPLDDTMTAMRSYYANTYGKVEVVAEGRGKEHVAQILRFPDGLKEFEADDDLIAFKREDSPSTIEIGHLPAMPHYAVHDVPEFDTPHYETPLLAKFVEILAPAEKRSAAERILVLNPRHGFLAALLAHERHPSEIAILSRDTLEAAVAKRNLEAALTDWKRAHETRVVVPPTDREHGWLPAAVRDEFTPGFDWIVCHLNWKEGPDALIATLKILGRSLSSSGQIVVACRSGQIESLRHSVHLAGFRDGRTISKKGNTAVVLKRPTPKPK